MRSFAIVPAAGHSRRMGRPKLLLPWHETTVFHTVLASWLRSDVTHTIVVARKNDVPLHEICLELGGDLVTPESDPPEMKISIQHAMTYIQRTYQPTSRDAWLLAPADLPRLSTPVINRVLKEYQKTNSIVVPSMNGRQGHPVVFPWDFSRMVMALGSDEGVNRLLQGNPKIHVTIDEHGVFDDIDTPSDYHRLQGDTD